MLLASPVIAFAVAAIVLEACALLEERSRHARRHRYWS
jgi:hypothetical protein